MRPTMARGLACVALIVLATSAVAQTSAERTATRETMRNMRRVAVAWEAYATTENRFFPASAFVGHRSPGSTGGASLDWNKYLPVSYGAVSRLLCPDYIDALPVVDGWGRPFEFAVAGNDTDGALEYVIRSLGADGLEDEGVYKTGSFAESRSDIVLSMDAFVRFPRWVSQVTSDPRPSSGGWTTSLAGPDAIYATITNEDGDMFGKFCGETGCAFVFSSKTTCAEDGDYSVLLNTDVAATATKVKCSIVGGSFLFTLTNTQDLQLMVQGSSMLGIAMALDGGTFLVQRFSLSGAKEAIQQLDKAAAETVRKRATERL